MAASTLASDLAEDTNLLKSGSTSTYKKSSVNCTTSELERNANISDVKGGSKTFHHNILTCNIL